MANIFEVQSKDGNITLKKRVNRDKCSFATKQCIFGVFAIDEPRSPTRALNTTLCGGAPKLTYGAPYLLKVGFDVELAHNKESRWICACLFRSKGDWKENQWEYLGRLGSYKDWLGRKWFFMKVLEIPVLLMNCLMNSERVVWKVSRGKENIT